MKHLNVEFDGKGWLDYGGERASSAAPAATSPSIHNVEGHENLIRLKVLSFGPTSYSSTDITFKYTANIDRTNHSVSKIARKCLKAFRSKG